MEENAFGWLDADLAEDVRVLEREFDDFRKFTDLCAESAEVFPGEIGFFDDDEFFCVEGFCFFKALDDGE